jgi:hypothetical protein
MLFGAGLPRIQDYTWPRGQRTGVEEDVEEGTAFLSKLSTVINRIHQQRLKEVEGNRERLWTIVETIIILGR